MNNTFLIWLALTKIVKLASFRSGFHKYPKELWEYSYKPLLWKICTFLWIWPNTALLKSMISGIIYDRQPNPDSTRRPGCVSEGALIFETVSVHTAVDLLAHLKDSSCISDNNVQNFSLTSNVACCIQGVAIVSIHY